MVAPKCPIGMTLRKAYTRSNGTRVAATCVSGSKVPASKRVLPKPVKGRLGVYGYHDIKNLSVAARHAALLKGVKTEGYSTIVKRVNLIANFNTTRDPQTHKLMRSDIEWMKAHRQAMGLPTQRSALLAPEYSLTAARKRGSKAASKRSTKERVRKTVASLRKSSKAVSKRKSMSRKRTSVSRKRGSKAGSKRKSVSRKRKSVSRKNGSKAESKRKSVSRKRKSVSRKR